MRSVWQVGGRQAFHRLDEGSFSSRERAEFSCRYFCAEPQCRKFTRPSRDGSKEAGTRYSPGYSGKELVREVSVKYGAPGGIRTPDLLVRSHRKR